MHVLLVSVIWAAVGVYDPGCFKCCTGLLEDSPSDDAPGTPPYPSAPALVEVCAHVGTEQAAQHSQGSWSTMQYCAYCSVLLCFL